MKVGSADKPIVVITASTVQPENVITAEARAKPERPLTNSIKNI